MLVTLYYSKVLSGSNQSTAVFSLNFSSAGKGPFMDGKAKNIYFSKGRGGRGDGGVRDMDPPSLGNFLFPYFKTYFTQICYRYL